MSAISFNATNSSVSLRVYYAAANNMMLEKGYDGQSWYDGGFKEATVPGSDVSAIDWGNVNIRVYFQNGTQISAVSEWVWNGNWTQGVKAIPPGTS